MKKNSIIVFFLLCTSSILAQQIGSHILTIDTFIQKVKLHHPLVKIAALQVDKANANLQFARGGFDPIFEYESSNKTFDKKNYYNHNNAQLKVPLPIGDIKTGIENNDGQFLGSEFTSGKSSYLGLEIPIAKGLLLDKRRATLQQAKIAIELNTAQRNALINDLLLDAYITYYQWAASYKLYNVFNGYLQISQNRLNLVKTLNANGDRALMDTVEAFTQVQNLQLMQADAAVKLSSAVLELNNFVWDGNGIPQNIADNIVPDTTITSNNRNEKILMDLLQQNMIQNPLLKQYKFKIDVLQVDRKLKYQSLLPTINLKGNLLNKNYFVANDISGSLLQNNNKWGIDIKIPLLFREARAEYKLAKIKIKESQLELMQKTVEIDNKIKDYFNQYTQLQSQLSIASKAFDNYNSLLKNELLRFSNGESSLFLVNSRENKLLEMQQKIIELQVKLLKAKYTLDWAAGIIK